MKRAGVLLAVCFSLLLTGCGAGRKSLALRFPEIAVPIEVERYSIEGFVDTCCLWKVTLPDSGWSPSQLRGFERKGGERGLSSARHPQWWPGEKALAELTAYYHREGEVYRIIWQGVEARVFYIQWFDT
jgi:hypothetical protein